MTTWLGDGYPDVAGTVAERIRRYRERVADGSTIEEPVRCGGAVCGRESPDRHRLGRGARGDRAGCSKPPGIASLFQAIVSADAVTEEAPSRELSASA